METEIKQTYTEERLMLTSVQLQLLLQCAGCREFTGPQLEKQRQTEEEVIEQVHRMAADGMLLAQDGRFAAAPALAEDLLRMKNAALVLEVNAADKLQPPYYCYAEADRLTILQRSAVKKETLALQSCTAEAFMELLEADGFFGLSPCAGDMLSPVVLVGRLVSDGTKSEAPFTAEGLAQLLKSADEIEKGEKDDSCGH